MTRAVGASERVFEIIDRQPSMNISGGITPSSISGRVSFNKVSFAYPARKDKVILSDFSLVLEPGQVVGVVGMSGSGKTTLTQLLLRLYEVDGGSVTIDGTDIRDLDPKWLRDSIGFVGQEPVLFNMSVLESILLAKNQTIRRKRKDRETKYKARKEV
jgi:ABC-type multidrug transport system fused ATPase/permease subunit